MDKPICGPLCSDVGVQGMNALTLASAAAADDCGDALLNHRSPEQRKRLQGWSILAEAVRGSEDT